MAGACTSKDQVLGLFGEVMEVHGGTLRLEVADIFANDDRGVVLTQEAGTTGGKQLTLTGVHLRGSATAGVRDSPPTRRLLPALLDHQDRSAATRAPSRSW